jgi:hypothetical protein
MNRKRAFISASVCLFLLSSCQTDPKSVNSKTDLPIFPVLVPMPQYMPDQAPAIVGLSGKVFLKSEIPLPLANVRLGLFQQTSNGEKMVHEFSSARDGSFEITRSIQRGQYLLKVTDPRYQGQMAVSLIEKPAIDLIFEITKN